MFWFRKVLVFWTWNHHVLSMYWLSTGGFVPSVKSLKESREEQRKVINWLTAKLIAVEQYTEDIQKKVFPKVRRSRAI
jgi:hypothetical protein